TCLLCLEHLAIAEVERHVLATAGPVEDDVAAAHLRCRDLAAHVVLRTGVMRQPDPDPGERVQDQSGAVEPHGAGAVVDAAAWPPPHEYGTPICDMPRRITYSEACRPYTRGICPLVKPVSVGLRMPNCCRNCLPMFAVTCDEVAEMPSTELMIAIGSPLTKALGTMGKVGSQTEASHL